MERQRQHWPGVRWSHQADARHAIYQGTPLPVALPGAPGCDVLAAPAVTTAELISVTGTASSTIVVPNTAILMGTEVLHQWALLDAVNTLGIVVSDVGKATFSI